MNNALRVAIVLAVAAGAAGIMVMKSHSAQDTAQAAKTAPEKPGTPLPDTKAPTPALPRLVDLGSVKCIPCKMMAPILEELRKSCAGKLDVVFIDVWEKPEEANKYKVNLIPSQVFYDATGQERFRHEGFYSKEDIVAKWKELGVDLSASVSTGAAETAPATPAQAVPAAPDSAASSTINEAYPGLTSGALVFAQLGDLPEGVLLRSGSIEVVSKDLEEQITKAPEPAREGLKKNGVFMLEQMVTKKLVVELARQQAAEAKRDIAAKSEQELIDAYIQNLVEPITATDEAIAKFYEENKDACGGATLDQMKDQLKGYVLKQKRQDAIEEHIRTLGQRLPIVVAAGWTKEQAVSARDNPVDKARGSGKATLVDFGADGCRPCEMMTPILASLTKKYEGKANVLFVHVREEQILASRYGVQSIPVQVFFDKDGKETYRHVGFFPQADIEKRLAGMGVQ